MKSAKWLKAHGYDGLYAPGEPCGCWLGDLVPCGEKDNGCKPGYFQYHTKSMMGCIPYSCQCVGPAKRTRKGKGGKP